MMKAFQSNSYLFGGNAPYVEELYEQYLDNPGSVPEQWRAYFDNLQLVPASDGRPQTRDVAHAPIVESFAERAKAGLLTINGVSLANRKEAEAWAKEVVAFRTKVTIEAITKAIANKGTLPAPARRSGN